MQFSSSGFVTGNWSKIVAIICNAVSENMVDCEIDPASVMALHHEPTIPEPGCEVEESNNDGDDDPMDKFVQFVHATAHKHNFNMFYGPKMANVLADTTYEVEKICLRPNLMYNVVTFPMICEAVSNSVAIEHPDLGLGDEDDKHNVRPVDNYIDQCVAICISRVDFNAYRVLDVTNNIQYHQLNDYFQLCNMSPSTDKRFYMLRKDVLSKQVLSKLKLEPLPRSNELIEISVVSIALDDGVEETVVGLCFEYFGTGNNTCLLKTVSCAYSDGEVDAIVLKFGAPLPSPLPYVAWRHPSKNLLVSIDEGHFVLGDRDLMYYEMGKQRLCGDKFKIIDRVELDNKMDITTTPSNHITLPNDIWVKIFQLDMSYKTLASIEQVCPKFKGILELKVFPRKANDVRFVSRDLKCISDKCDKIVGFITKFGGHIEYLDFDDFERDNVNAVEECTLSSAFYEAIPILPQTIQKIVTAICLYCNHTLLKELRFGRLAMNAISFNQLTLRFRTSVLRLLSVRASTLIKNESFRLTRYPKSLEVFELNKANNVSAVLLYKLGDSDPKLPLKKLIVRDAHNLYNKPLSHLLTKYRTDLACLDLSCDEPSEMSYGFKMTPQLLINIHGTFEAMKELVLTNTGLASNALIKLIPVKFPLVETLALGGLCLGATPSQHDIKCNSVKRLAALKHLKALSISQFDNDHTESLTAIISCGLIERLKVCSVEFKGIVLLSLATLCKNLQYLDISNCMSVCESDIVSMLKVRASDGFKPDLYIMGHETLVNIDGSIDIQQIMKDARFNGFPNAIRLEFSSVTNSLSNDSNMDTEDDDGNSDWEDDDSDDYGDDFDDNDFDDFSRTMQKEIRRRMKNNNPLGLSKDEMFDHIIDLHNYGGGDIF